MCKQCNIDLCDDKNSCVDYKGSNLKTDTSNRSYIGPCSSFLSSKFNYQKSCKVV